MEEEQVKISYIPRDENPVDIFTKPLPKAKFWTFVVMLGLRLLGEETKNEMQR